MNKANRAKSSFLISYLKEQYIEACIAIGVFFAACVRIVLYYISYLLWNTSFPFNAISSIFFSLLQIALIIAFVLMIVRRIKAHTFLDTLLVYRLLKAMPLIYKTVLKIIVPFILVMIFWVFSSMFSVYGYMIYAMIAAIFMSLISCFGVVDQFARVRQITKNIAQGEKNELEHTAGMYVDTKEMATELYHIDEGLKKALEESIKAEHLKTELITNVSHDIKTPLTSIINYVDLLKKQDIKDETACAYLKVLERNSNRLKILTNDLVEASKTSTGNIEMRFEKLGLVELIAQAYGGFDTIFAEKNIEFVFNPTEEIEVLADGNYTWRVFQNLFSNAAKYSLENTRVYGEVFIKGEFAHFVLKNVSAEPLNISEQELMEQFVQGERSRHTEGSGLGLYIAKNIMELMKGKLQININGDLFEADVSLKRAF